MVLLHFQVGLNLYVILQRALRESEGPWRLLPLFTPTMSGWIISGWVHRKSSARKATHLSTIVALGGLTSKFS
jgi:hypothetical protein